MKRKFYIAYRFMDKEFRIGQSWTFAEVLVLQTDEGLTQQTVEEMHADIERRHNAQEGTARIDFIYPLADLAQ